MSSYGYSQCFLLGNKQDRLLTASFLTYFIEIIKRLI
jgi:hypothetical protein